MADVHLISLSHHLKRWDTTRLIGRHHNRHSLLQFLGIFLLLRFPFHIFNKNFRSFSAAAAWVDTVEQFGNQKLSLSEILAPATRMAEEGFPVSQVCAKIAFLRRVVCLTICDFRCVLIIGVEAKGFFKRLQMELKCF